MLLANAPPEYADRATLWNTTEKAETRFDAQLSRDIIAALPRELPFDQSIEMLKEFCRGCMPGGARPREERLNKFYNIYKPRGETSA